MRRILGVSLTLALVAGCSERREAPPPPSPVPSSEPAPIPTPPPVSQPDPTAIAPTVAPPTTPEALEALVATLDDDTDPALTGLAAATVAAPTTGPRCALEPASGATLWPGPGAVASAYVGDVLIAALHAGDATRDELVLLAVTRGRARPIVRIPLTVSNATLGMRPPVVADLGNGRAGIASIDRAGKLLYVEAAPSGSGVTRRELATDADSRFAAAVAGFGEKRVVVYAKRGSPLHVTMLVLDATLRTTSSRDITPDASGAASPFFARSAAGPTLVLVDPREGFSPIYRIPIGTDAMPAQGVVLRPVTGLLDPARIVLAVVGTELHLAYVAHGASQASAVGYVRGAANAPQPVSLVRPTGFGGLWVDAVSLPELAVFAATAPLSREPTAPRAIHVRAATTTTLGEATTFTLPDGLHYPSLAVHPSGVVTLTASSLTEVTSVRLHCTP